MGVVVVFPVGAVHLYESYRNLFNSSLLLENTGMNEVRLIGGDKD